MKNKKVFVLIVIMVLPVFIINNLGTINATVPSNGKENKINMVDDYTLAPDFNITDVDSHIEYSLSDFQGKIVMLDFFATWCGPCIAALPTIREFYLLYPENMFQIISIDVDWEESEALISGFRDSYGMDWIVGSDPMYDENNTVIWDHLNYGSGFIPTMYILNQTGHVVYSEIGFDEVTVRSLLGSLLPDDTVTPYFTDLTFYNTTELSIFNPRFYVSGWVYEDRNIKQLDLRIVNGETVTFHLNYVDMGSYYAFDQAITLDPLFLYPLANLELQIYVKDYWNHSNLTAVNYLPVTQYVDSGPPTISNTAVEWHEVSDTRYNVTVFATLEEDLIFLKKDVWFMKGDLIIKAATFENYNATHMVASAELLYSQAMPWELTAHIVVRDAAGNEVTEDLAVAEPPTTTPSNTETSEESNFALLIPLSILVGLVTVVFIRKRR